jgi:hypothetical protein
MKRFFRFSQFPLSSTMRGLGSRIITVARGSSQGFVQAPGIFTRYLPSLFQRLFSLTSLGFIGVIATVGFFISLPISWVLDLIRYASNNIVINIYNDAARSFAKRMGLNSEFQVTLPSIGINENGHELVYIGLTSLGAIVAIAILLRLALLVAKKWMQAAWWLVRVFYGGSVWIATGRLTDTFAKLTGEQELTNQGLRPSPAPPADGDRHGAIEIAIPPFPDKPEAPGKSTMRRLEAMTTGTAEASRTDGMITGKAEESRTDAMTTDTIEESKTDTFAGSEQLQNRYQVPARTAKAEDSLQRMYKEMKSRIEGVLRELRSREEINLGIGMIFSFIGVLSLIILIFMGVGKDEDFLKWFIPKVSVALFIQIFAYFFLRLYRGNLLDIKYFNNELTNIEFKMVAARLAIAESEEQIRMLLCVDQKSISKVQLQSVIKQQREVLQKIFLELLKTERNFLLKKGESTISLREFEQSVATDGELLERLTKSIKDMAETIRKRS